MKQATKISNSSNIAHVEYDDETKDLTVTFHSGKSYVYHNIPEKHYTGMINAESVGKYFTTHIKDGFKFTKG